MKLPGLQLKDLSTHYQNVNLVQETARQIIKDLEIFGYEIEFSGKQETAYNELSSQLTPIIDRLLSTNYQQLLTVLYKIDLDEKRISQLILDFNEQNVSAQIAHLIIERELKKVLIRNYFKNQQNEG